MSSNLPVLAGSLPLCNTAGRILNLVFQFPLQIYNETGSGNIGGDLIRRWEISYTASGSCPEGFTSVSDYEWEKSDENFTENSDPPPDGSFRC
jgi:hypothetical protein